MSESGRRHSGSAGASTSEEQREETQQKACRWLLLTTTNLYRSAIERTIAPCTGGSWIACWSPDDGSVLQQKVLSLKGVDFRWVFLPLRRRPALAHFVRSFVRSFARDRVPPSLDAVALAYRDKVREGSWTVGLVCIELHVLSSIELALGTPGLDAHSRFALRASSICGLPRRSLSSTRCTCRAGRVFGGGRGCGGGGVWGRRGTSVCGAGGGRCGGRGRRMRARWGGST